MVFLSLLDSHTHPWCARTYQFVYYWNFTPWIIRTRWHYIWINCIKKSVFISLKVTYPSWLFLQIYLHLRGQVGAISGNSKNSSSFLNASITTLLHTISKSEKRSYVAHINSYLGDDPFLKKYLPLDPATDDLFNLAKDGVLLWYLT